MIHNTEPHTDNLETLMTAAGGGGHGGILFSKSVYFRNIDTGTLRKSKFPNFVHNHNGKQPRDCNESIK
jgi:hypothetical protein